MTHDSFFRLSRAFVLATGLSAGAANVSHAAPRSHHGEAHQSCKLIQHGSASWYGPGFNGRRTASGKIFNENQMTAAHKTLPFGTKVTVVASNGRAAQVTITDRGPYVSGRIIDVTKAAASELGFRGAGHTRVDLYLC